MGREVWDRVIAYHDPGSNWPNFQGNVHIVTTWPNGTFAEEELELRRPDDYRQSPFSGPFTERGLLQTIFGGCLSDSPEGTAATALAPHNQCTDPPFGARGICPARTEACFA